MIFLALCFALSSLFLLHSRAETCVQTSREWAQIYEGFAHDTLCGMAWKRLLSIDVINMRVRENQLWILVAQQYIATRLNLITLHPHSDNMTESVLLIADSLELHCDNVSQWELLPILEDALLHLFLFNHGHLQSPACASLDKNLTTEREESFFYFNSIDTVVIRDPLTNLTYTHSEYKGIFNTNISGLAIIGFLVFLLLACFLARVVDKSQNKRYRWSEKLKTDAHDYQLQERKKENERSEMNHYFGGMKNSPDYSNSSGSNYSVNYLDSEIVSDEINSI